MNFDKNKIINLVRNYDKNNTKDALIFIKEPLFCAIGSNKLLVIYLYYLLDNLYDNSNIELQNHIICRLNKFIEEHIND